MGANVELDIFLKKEDFSLQQIFSLLRLKRFSIYIQDMRTFDDWKYANENIFNGEDAIIMNRSIFLKKFTLINFVVNNKWRCVLISSLLEEMYVNFSFALDIDDLLQGEENDADGRVALLYDSVTDAINQISEKEPFKECFLVASMGIEYSVHFDRNVVTMLNDDNGVKRWIFSKDIGKDIQVEKFFKEEKSNTFVFTLFSSGQ